MSKLNMKHFAKSFRNGLSKHSPEILTAIGIGGMITTTIMAVKATPKALKNIEEVKEIEGHGAEEKSPIFKMAKAVWKPYLPATITGAISIGCLISANSVNAKRNAALVTAYKLSEAALVELKDAVVDTVGEENAEKIREKVTEKKVKEHMPPKSEIFIPNNGDVPCIDGMTGRIFQTNKNKIDSAVNEINRLLNSYDYVSLNEFYDEIGLERVDLGEELGWNTIDVGRGGVSIDLDSRVTDDGVPCLVLDYRIRPRYDYSNLS